MSRVTMVADAIEPLFHLYLMEWDWQEAESRFQQVQKLKERLGPGFSERLVVCDKIEPRSDGVSELAIIAEFLAITALQYKEMDGPDELKYHRAFGREWRA